MLIDLAILTILAGWRFLLVGSDARLFYLVEVD